ncbi:MAG: substrate-binding domain-containing protein, partial [Chloroflexi bacterium]|nr:substrate-binding domain-containing protein [Chloroflexota bacterium]
MNRKVLFLVILAAMLVAPLTLVTAQDSYTLGLSLSTLNNPFFVTLRDGAQAAADAAGAQLVVVDSQDDPATEAANMEDLIAQGVDAILVNPTDGDAIVPSIEAA